MTIYSEKLNPPIGLSVSTLLLIPGFGLMLGPINWYLAFVIGVAVTITVNVLLYNFSPSIVVNDKELVLGKAVIPLEVLRNPVAKTGDDAFRARGPELTPDTYFQIRGGIDPVVLVENIDPEDPYRKVLISTRHPDNLVEALASAVKAN
ncbi:MAG TPA: DUF3093 domain-containing protein [Microbacteriaceae bacterium]